MWQQIVDDKFGLMKAFSDSIAATVRTDSNAIPNLHYDQTLIVTSDYSGHHKSSTFEAYSFLIAGFSSLDRWEAMRIKTRKQAAILNRRVSYKDLGDAKKRRMLPAFLRAANTISGLCVSVLVEKRVRTLFSTGEVIDLTKPEFAWFSRLKNPVAERLLRVIHFGSFLIAGLSRQNQNILWFTDQDDIVANAAAVRHVTAMGGHVIGHYLPHPLRHIRFGTTSCDNGTLQIEDLAAIPDLAAGATAEIVNAYIARNALPQVEPFVPPPNGLSSKGREIMDWLSDDRWTLRRITFVIRCLPGTNSLQLSRLQFHGTQLAI